MARELTELAGTPMGAVDCDLTTPLNNEKVVDITEDCPDREDKKRELILYYGTNTESPFVRITERTKGQPFGIDVFWYLPISDDLSLGVYVGFLHIAKEFGLTPPQLRGMVNSHQPSCESS